MDLINDILLKPAVIFFIANSLYVLSYMLTDMLLLRITACIASFLTMPYYYFLPEPLWLPLLWQNAFFFVNAINLLILLYGRRKRPLPPVRQQAYENYFSDLKEYEVFPLLNIAKEVKAPKGQKLVYANQPLNELIFVLEGDCNISIGNKTVNQLDKGQFIGEMAFISGKKASADVIANKPVLYLSWDQAELRKLFNDNNLYKHYFASMMNTDLFSKLTNMNKLNSERVREQPPLPIEQQY